MCRTDVSFTRINTRTDLKIEESDGFMVIDTSVNVNDCTQSKCVYNYTSIDALVNALFTDCLFLNCVITYIKDCSFINCEFKSYVFKNISKTILTFGIVQVITSEKV